MSQLLSVFPGDEERDIFVERLPRAVHGGWLPGFMRVIGCTLHNVACSALVIFCCVLSPRLLGRSTLLGRRGNHKVYVCRGRGGPEIGAVRTGLPDLVLTRLKITPLMQRPTGAQVQGCTV